MNPKTLKLKYVILESIDEPICYVIWIKTR